MHTFFKSVSWKPKNERKNVKIVGWDGDLRTKSEYSEGVWG